MLYGKGIHMKYFYLVCVLLISGCAYHSLEQELQDKTLESITGKNYSRNPASCPRIKQRCGTHGNYQEWYQENGKLACACNE